MSGLEIAGLTLGAFPIMLRLLDDYRKGAEAMGDWWQIRRAYEEWKHDLDYHRTAFELNSKLILMPLMEDDEVEKFLSDPLHETWRDKMWEKRLRERLPDSYESVVNVINGIYDIMETMRKELGVHNTGFQTKISEKGKAVKGRAAVKYFFSAENIDFQKERFRLVSKKDSRKRLSAKLKESNDRLRDLVSGNDQVADARRSRDYRQPPPTANKKLQDYWRHAKRLYEALSKAANLEPTGPECRCVGHVANLELATKDPTKIQFGVLFSGMDHNGSLAWRETKIEMVPNPDSDNGAAPVGAGRTSTRVSFAVSNRVTGSTQTHNNTRQIRNLCEELSNRPQGCVGFMDEDEKRFMVYRTDCTIRDPGVSIITLDSILHTSQTLTRRQRYSLAHTIATWFLRLGSTPWISLPLQANIVFFQDTTASSLSNMDIEKLYIGGELANSAPIPLIDAIHSLGVCLLELCFDSSLESYKIRNRLSGGPAALAPLLDYAAALQWSKDVNGEAGPDFAEAIEWCLQARSQSDESWRKDIWAHVIVPLSNCRNHLSQRIAI